MKQHLLYFNIASLFKIFARNQYLLLLLPALTILAACSKNSLPLYSAPLSQPANSKTDVDFWLTKADQSALLEKQTGSLIFKNGNNENPTIEIDTTQVFQSIEGFGYTLTGGSATLINSLSATGKDALLKELFSTEGNGIGVSYLRISIGASDLSAEPFTYNDLPAGQTDENLTHFSIEREKTDLIPILKKIMAIQPNIKILGSPWSAPTWMKTNNSFIGGSLKPEYYPVYAQYFVKYIRAMAKEGITIDAITIQNEPLHPGNNPSMYMEAADQGDFIKNHLGPAFVKAGIKTKIILYDHNADRPDYPISILNDPEAKKYVDGSAFHLYAGLITALSQVHQAHPDKHVYFTEQWIGGPGNFQEDLKWHVGTLIIGATRNWSRNVLEWNLAADPNYQPHTDKGGCKTCLGALTIGPDGVRRNTAYYVIGHASKFVPPGSVRVHSNLVDNLANVAFVTPEGRKVLIVLNQEQAGQEFNIKFKGKITSAYLEGGAVSTFTW